MARITGRATLAATTLALLAASALPGGSGRVAYAESSADRNASAPSAQDDIIARIRTEGLQHSQLPQTLSYLSDVIGPRLTGSPGLKRANDWTRSTLEKWGMKNAHLESWGPFGRGWTCDAFALQVVGPTAFPVIAMPKAWSTAWNGTTEVVYIDAIDEAGLAKYKGKLKGKIVLLSPLREVAAHFESLGSRYTDEVLDRMAQGGARRPGGGGGFPGGGAGLTDEQRRQLQQRAFVGRKLSFARDEGAAMALDSVRGDGGTIFVQSATLPVTPSPTAPGLGGANGGPGGAFGNGGGQPGAPGPGGGQPGGGQPPRRASVWDRDAEKRMIPQVAVSVEHYNRLLRMVLAGEDVRVSCAMKVHFNDDNGGMVYNTIAEIPGSDKADEIVMCGGHLDSWHGGTGATDNGAGVAVCMEAMRILQTLGVKPRRTVRIGLWSGEEQGLYGSREYVRQHFGTRAAPKPELSRFSAYFNLDNGTGKIRGVYCQGNSAVAPIFAEWLKPFADLGASTITLSNTGGTDHQSFDGVGLPGFQFIQDTIEYDSRTHHSNQDVYDRIQEADLKQAATIMAAFLYNAAMRDEPLPRKPAGGNGPFGN